MGSGFRLRAGFCETGGKGSSSGFLGFMGSTYWADKFMLRRGIGFRESFSWRGPKQFKKQRSFLRAVQVVLAGEVRSLGVERSGDVRICLGFCPAEIGHFRVQCLQMLSTCMLDLRLGCMVIEGHMP